MMEIKKKLIKTLADSGKNLSKSTYFIILNNLLISGTFSDNNETTGIHICEIKDIELDNILNILNGKSIDGSKFTKVLGGTKFKCDEYDKQLHMESLIKVDDGTELYYLSSNDFKPINECEYGTKIFETYLKYSKYINQINNWKEYNCTQKQIESLLSRKKFTIDLCDKLDTVILDVTNKMIKNFNKNTEFLIFKRSMSEIIPDSGLYMLQIENIAKNIITKSFYAYIDKDK